MFCSVRYRWWWNPCFSFHPLYFCPEKESIVLLWCYVSAQCLNYPICKTINCWRSVDALFDHEVIHMSCTISNENSARKLYMNYWSTRTLRLPKMQHPKSLMFRWCSLSRWGREDITFVLASKGGQILIYGCLRATTIYITKMLHQTSLTLHWRSFSGWGRECGAIVLASEGSWYFLYGWLQPITTSVTQDEKPIIIDALLTPIFRMGQWLCHLIFSL